MTTADIEGGFVLLARKIFENPILREGDRFRAWCWLISEAAWKPCRVRVTSGRAAEMIDLDRGQLTHSRRYLATAWRWSEKRARTFLADLKREGMITVQTGRLQNVITICKYEDYQSTSVAEGQQTGQQKGPAWAQQGPKEEQLKTKKEISPSKSNPLGWPLDAFDLWYSGYPKRVEKIAAQKAFAKIQAAGDVTFDQLMAARDRYVAAVKDTERQFIKGPAVWLNKGCYLDETPGAVAGAAIAEPARDPKTFSETDWRDRVREFGTSGAWSEKYWGPRPGAPGCLVPAHLIMSPVEASHA